MDAEPQNELLDKCESYLKSLASNGQTQYASEFMMIFEMIKKKENENTKSIVTKSSTQMSAESKSTAFLAPDDPLKALISDFLATEGIAEPINKTIDVKDFNLHFAFLFSSPLVLNTQFQDGQVKVEPMKMEISYSSEIQHVKRVLEGIHARLKFMSSVATQMHFSQILDRHPMVLHFSGHGVKNTVENFGILTDQSEGDKLVFEDLDGSADFVSCAAIRRMLSKLKKGLEFVFVASCHSEIVGEVFLQAGASHVVCVKQDERILDEACLGFTTAFYHSYFSGNFTICEAFSNAKETIRASSKLPMHEHSKFICLFKEDPFEDHICTRFTYSEPHNEETDESQHNGSSLLVDLTKQPVFHRVPARVEGFIGRNIDMHEVIKLVFAHRLVTVRGLNGIGKSSLIIEVANHLSERHCFTDGIIYIDVRNCETIEALMAHFNSTGVLVGADLRTYDFKANKEPLEKMISRMVSVFNEKEMLLILDNIDLLVYQRNKQTRDFVFMLLTNCKMLRVVCTSRSHIGGFSSFSEKVHKIEPLPPLDATLLLLRSSPRKISEEEIEELLLLGKGRHVRSYSQPVSNKGKQEKHVPPIERLKDHRIIQCLAGHPQYITIAAAQLCDKTLLEVYSSLEKGGRGLDQDLEESLSNTIDQLKQNDVLSTKLFGLLGFLPGGVALKDIHSMLGDDPALEAGLDTLVRHSLVKKKKEGSAKVLFTLESYMLGVANKKNSVESSTYKLFNFKVFVLVKNKLSYFFRVLGSLDKNPKRQKELESDFLQQEPNIRACFERIMAENGILTHSGVSLARSAFFNCSQEIEEHSGSDESGMSVIIEEGKYEEEYSAKKKKKQDSSSKKEKDYSIVSSSLTQRSSNNVSPNLQRQKMDEEVSYAFSLTRENLSLLAGINELKSDNANSIFKPRESIEMNVAPRPKSQLSAFSNAGSNISANSINKVGTKKLATSLTPGLKEECDSKGDLVLTPTVSVTPKNGQRTGSHQISPRKDESHKNLEIDKISSSQTLRVSQEGSQVSSPQTLSPRNLEVINPGEDFEASNLEKNSETGPNKSPANDLVLPEGETVINQIKVESSNEDGEEHKDEIQMTGRASLLPRLSKKVKKEVKSSKVSEISDFDLDNIGIMTQEIPENEQFQGFFPNPELVQGFSQAETASFGGNHMLSRNCSEQVDPFEESKTGFRIGDDPFKPEEEPLSPKFKESRVLNEETPKFKSKKEMKLPLPSSDACAKSKKSQTTGSSSQINSPMVMSVTRKPSQRRPSTTFQPPSQPNTRASLAKNKPPSTQEKRLSNTSVSSAKGAPAQPRPKTKVGAAKPKSSIKEDPQSGVSNRGSGHGKLSTGSKKTEERSVSLSGAVDKGLFAFSKEDEKKQAEMFGNSVKMLVDYTIILIFFRRYQEVLAFIQEIQPFVEITRDPVGHANIMKVQGCVYYLQKEIQKSENFFEAAYKEFTRYDCLLGQAQCLLAIGCMKVMTGGNYNAGIKKLNDALSAYSKLKHTYGIYTCHSLLAKAYNKKPDSKEKKESKENKEKHQKEARAVLKADKNVVDFSKQVMGFRYRDGVSYVKWGGDPIGLFSEPAFKVNNKTLASSSRPTITRKGTSEKQAPTGSTSSSVKPGVVSFGSAFSKEGRSSGAKESIATSRSHRKVGVGDSGNNSRMTTHTSDSDDFEFGRTSDVMNATKKPKKATNPSKPLASSNLSKTSKANK